MPSVVGLLEQRELGARRRVDELREEADRVQAELAVAEREWKEWVIARSRVGEVLAPVDETEDHARTERAMPAEEASSASRAAKPKSQVPLWREGTGLVCAIDRLPAHPAGSCGPASPPSRAADLPGDGRLVRPGRGAGEGGGAAVEGETPGRARLAGRTAAGPLHARAECDRVRRRVMSRVIDQ